MSLRSRFNGFREEVTSSLSAGNTLQEEEEWKRVVDEVVRKWTGRSTRKRDTCEISPPQGGPAKSFQEILREAGFESIEDCYFPHSHVWTLDSIIGYLYSTSICSKTILGDRAEAFEAELKNALATVDSEGHFLDTMNFKYTLGRKP